MMNWKQLTRSAAGLVLGAALAAPAFAEDKIDFAKQIEPIFAQNCYKCHGEKDKGGLKLNSVEAIKKGGDDGPALVPGDLKKSAIYARIILPEDHDDIMPPKGGPLPKAQQELIGKWITQGGDFGDWKMSDPKKGAAPAAGGDSKADAGKPGAGAAAAAPAAEAPLPQVAAADGGALEKLGGAGGRAMPLAQGTNLLAVNFAPAADQTDDAKLALLAPVSTQVFELNLANSKVTDAGLAPLEGLTNLRRLHLEKTGVGDEGLKHLKGLSNLEYLNLYGTKVSDAGIENLKDLKSLKKVYLWQTQVTDAGAAKLKEALPNVTVDTGWKEPEKKPEAATAGADKKDEKKDESAKKDDAKKDDAAKKTETAAKAEPEKKADAGEKKSDEKKAESTKADASEKEKDAAKAKDKDSAKDEGKEKKEQDKEEKK